MLHSAAAQPGQPQQIELSPSDIKTLNPRSGVEASRSEKSDDTLLAAQMGSLGWAGRDNPEWMTDREEHETKDNAETF